MTFYVDTTNITGGGLITSTTDTTPVRFQGFARTAESVPIVIQPVLITGINTTSADYSASDTVEVFAGPADDPPTGGTFTLTLGSTTSDALDYNVSKHDLEDAFADLCTAEGKPAPTVHKVAAGVWRITGNTRGAIGATGNCTIETEQLEPKSYGSVMEDDLGSASEPYSLLLVIRISPLVYQSTFTISSPNYTGTLTLNTVELFEYSQGQKDNPFHVPFSIRRTRSSGEVNTIFGPVSIPIYKESLNPLTATPTDIPSGGSGSGFDSILVQTSAGVQTAYDTLALAKAAAVSGDTIQVGPGSYTATANLLKNGVNWKFLPGATVTFTGSSDAALFSDWTDGANGAVTCIISGYATFDHQGTHADGTNSNTFTIANNSSEVRIECHEILNNATGANANAYPVRHCGGTLTIRCHLIDGVNGGVWWTSGPLFCTADVYSTSGAQSAGAIYAAPGVDGLGIPGPPFAYTSGDAYFFGQNVSGTNGPQKLVQLTGDYSNGARVWINIGGDIASECTTTVFIDGGRNYITAQKIGTTASGGSALYTQGNTSQSENWVLVEKISGGQYPVNISSNGSLGTITHLTTQHIEDVGNGATALLRVTGAGNVLNVDAADVIGGTGADGILISGSTCRFKGRINTALSTTKNPITISAGTLILQDAILIPNGSRASITASSGKTVYAHASGGKTALTNITIQPPGGFTVDSEYANF